MEYEDRLTISTPEGVELELTLAGIGSRFIASVIDHLLQFAIIAAAFAALLGLDAIIPDGTSVDVDTGDSNALGVAIITLFVFLVMFAYDVFFEVRGGGRTPGKRWTGLRVVRASGAPVGLVTSSTRNIIRVVDILPTFYGVGMAAIFSTRRNQRLGDLAAGTIVVRERKGGRKRGAPPPPAPPVAVATDGWDSSAVTPEQIATVRRFLERRAELTPEARATLAADLAGQLRPRVAGAPEALEPEPFLEALSAAKAARAG